DADVKALMDALKCGRVCAPFTTVSVQRYIATADAILVASELQRLSDAGVTKEVLGFILDLLADERCKDRGYGDSVDLVWTGPEVGGVPSRDTAVVVRELFANAREAVLVAGYAVHQGREVFAALANRMDALPSLKVEMFLDVQRLHGDTTLDSEILREFGHRF